MDSDAHADALADRHALAFLREHAAVVELVFDGEGRVRSANRYAEALLGGAAPGLRLEEVFLPGPRPPVLDELRRAPGRVLLHMGARGGAGAGLPQTLYFRFYDLGDAVLALGAADVEEQARLEREVLSLNAELANRARALHKANAELARLGELKNRFLGMVTHDLRRPIGLVMGYAELLLDELAGTLAGEHARMLERIRSSSALMARLVDEFLDVAVIESGALELQRAPTDLDAVLERALETVALAATRRGVQLVRRMPGAAAPLEADAVKLEQVFINLLANAIEHGLPDTSVWLERRDGPGEVRVAVRDEGPGLAEEDVARLFQPFVRGPRAGRPTSGEHRSVGLGLAIAQRIVALHGGALTVKSRLGYGATFEVSLPRPGRADREAPRR